MTTHDNPGDAAELKIFRVIRKIDTQSNFYDGTEYLCHGVDMKTNKALTLCMDSEL